MHASRPSSFPAFVKVPGSDASSSDGEEVAPESCSEKGDECGDDPSSTEIEGEEQSPNKVMEVPSDAELDSSKKVRDRNNATGVHKEGCGGALFAPPPLTSVLRTWQ